MDSFSLPSLEAKLFNRPATMAFNSRVNFIHQPYRFRQYRHNLLVMSYLINVQNQAFAVFQPFVTDLITANMEVDRLQQVAQALDVPIQSFFSDSIETLPIAVSEKLLLDSYRAIPNKEIQKSILKITTNATKQGE